jgi:hypothetical protein
MDDMLQEVRAAYSAGLCIVPATNDGTKTPDMPAWKQCQTVRPTREQMRAFGFAHRSGFGMIAGVVSGRRGAWDFDCPDTYRAFVAAADASGLGDVVRRIEAGYCDETPGGGRRWIVTYPDTVEWRDQTLARRPGRAGEPPVKTLIEWPTFSILAPSNGGTHPSGRPYIRLSGGFDTIAAVTAGEHADLISLARVFDAMPRPTFAQRVGVPPASPAGDRPGDDYNRRAPWSEILEPAGWTHVYDRGAVAHWRRPGKSSGSLSATTNIGGRDLLYVFSSSTVFEPDKSYSKFAAYAVLQHSGDFSAAASALAAQGYGTRPPAPAAPMPPTAGATPQPKASKKSKETAGRALKLEDPEEWPDPVAVDTLLDALTSLLSAFVVFVDPSHADALALWILHTYLMDAWSISPLAVVHSPTMRCGKTTVLQLTAHLASRALAASNISPAALFRAIEKYRPTLLLDEAETFLKENEELRGLVNAGHTRKTAVVIRTVGEQHEAAAFSTWCPKFIALIGRLAPTLMDRSIVIPMRRRMAGESVERLRLDRLEDRCVSLQRQAVRWANDTAAELQAADPHVPPELDDRAADNWRPLLAIAEAAGGAWVTRARTAAVALSRHDDGEQGLSIQLLSDVREVLKKNQPQGDTIASAELVRVLVTLEERPWPTCAKLDKPLTPNGLARLLKPFGIVPTGNLRIGEKVLKGYRLDAFEDVWERYLPPFQPLHRYKPNNDGPNSQFPTATRSTDVADRKVSFANRDGLCSGVADENPGEADRETLPTAEPAPEEFDV